METAEQLFLKYNYPETRDMCIHFLTLVSAILVFSLSMAEKVFDFVNASKANRRVIISGWCLFILSLIFCGIGLVFNSLAGGACVYQTSVSYQEYAGWSYLVIVLAGLFFIGGLLVVMISTIMTKPKKTKIEPHYSRR